MPRNNNIISRAKGRPKVSSVKSGTKDICKCIVDGCDVTKRGDKVRLHQREKVLWAKDGLPASDKHPEYESLSLDRKKHTDYFRDNGYTSTKFPELRSKHTEGPMDRFLSGAPKQKKPRLANNNIENDSEENDTDNNDHDEDDHYEDDSNEDDSNEDDSNEDANLECGDDDDIHLDDIDLTPPRRERYDDDCYESGGEGGRQAYSVTAESNPLSPSDVVTDVPGSTVSQPVAPHLVINDSLRVSDDDESAESGGGRGRHAAYSVTAASNPLSPSAERPAQGGSAHEGSVKLDERTIGDIGDEISSRFGNKVEVDQVGDLGKVIARRVIEEFENAKRRSEAAEKLKSEWIEDENYMTCAQCLRNSHDPAVPKNLRKYKKNNFGILKKQRCNKTNVTNMKTHSESPLHIWCASVDSAKQFDKVKEETRNDRACDMIITNAIHTLKDPTGSSQDFVRLNNKDSLNPELQFGEKNDGAEMFFLLRNLVFEKLSDKIKQMVQEVETLGVTLDKVTLGGQSYTVIVTYFFFNGEIKTVLNALFIMSTAHADGQGVAEMLCNTLRSTLGLSLEDLAYKLEHIREAFRKRIENRSFQ